MRAWIWTLILFIAAVALAIVLQDHRGNVIINIPPWQVSFSITFAVLTIFALCLAVYVVLRFLGWISGSPERYRIWRRHRAQQRDQQLLQRGWLALLDGRLGLAEKELTKLHHKSKAKETRLIAALTAARVLQQQNNIHGRDEYLAKAKTLTGHDNRLKVAFATAAAELYIRNNEPELAVALLQPIQDATTRHFHATRLLLRAQYMLNNYQQVYDLMRILLRRNAIPQDEAMRYLDIAVVHLIRQANELEFKNIWADLRGDERVRPDIAIAAAQKWLFFDNFDEAGRVLEAALNVSLHPMLLSEYGKISPEHYARRLSKAEEWLKKDPDNPDLLALLGQLCFKGQLWGQAEHYLKRSMAIRSDMRVHALLGSLYNAIGRNDEAVRHWLSAAEVAGSMPSVSPRVLLPAADTGADPKYGAAAFVHVTGSEDQDTEPVIPQPQHPIAASGVYEEKFDSRIKAQAIQKESESQGSHLRDYQAAKDEDDPHQYFDTAPIPGIGQPLEDRPTTKGK
ncbi:MAG TPA: heme biosynthesis HemY N-terminal domain-containing protein [Paenalcaligenes sp.]|nr:heme biosynthesis HemY N-terminal domain-containing protein [Paenalcaligenes sp.]